MRTLLAELGAAKRPVVVGCSSWAWAFLSKATDAALILSDSVTFRAFYAQRLHAWFAQAR